MYAGVDVSGVFAVQRAAACMHVFFSTCKAHAVLSHDPQLTLCCLAFVSRMALQLFHQDKFSALMNGPGLANGKSMGREGEMRRAGNIPRA